MKKKNQASVYATEGNICVRVESILSDELGKRALLNTEKIKNILKDAHAELEHITSTTEGTEISIRSKTSGPVVIATLQEEQDHLINVMDQLKELIAQMPIVEEDDSLTEEEHKYLKSIIKDFIGSIESKFGENVGTSIVIQPKHGLIVVGNMPLQSVVSAYLYSLEHESD